MGGLTHTLRARITTNIKVNKRGCLEGCATLICAFALGLTASPFAPAVTAAAWMLDIPPCFALVGAIAGSVLAGSYAGAMASALMVASGLLIAVWHQLDRPLKLVLLIASQLLTLPFYYMRSLAECLYGLSGILVSILAYAVLYKAGRGLRAFSIRALSDGEQVCICLMLVMIAVSPGRLDIFGVRLCCVLAALFTLCALRARGVYALIPAILLGAGCMLRGGAVEFAGGLALCALCASPFWKQKWLCPAAFCAAAAIAAFVIGGQSLSYIECALAALACLLLPERMFIAMREIPERPGADFQLQLRARVLDMAQVLSGLASLQVGLCALQLSGAAGALSALANSPEHIPKRFCVNTCAAACAKEGGLVTGDCMALREADGRMLLLLSDGMGSGEAAHRESASAIAMLGDLISVGFEPISALECVNQLLIQRGAEGAMMDMYATLDIAIADLTSGRVQFIKCGAPPRYIVRDGKLHAICAETLPAGIIETAVPALHEVTLSKGDSIVMLTDGVSDALGDELPSIISTCLEQADIAGAADAVLFAASERGRRDDMSVIVAHVT